MAANLWTLWWLFDVRATPDRNYFRTCIAQKPAIPFTFHCPLRNSAGSDSESAVLLLLRQRLIEVGGSLSSEL